MWQIHVLLFETFWNFFFFLEYFLLQFIEFMDVELWVRTADCIAGFSLLIFVNK